MKTASWWFQKLADHFNPRLCGFGAEQGKTVVTIDKKLDQLLSGVARIEAKQATQADALGKLAAAQDKTNAQLADVAALLGVVAVTGIVAKPGPVTERTSAMTKATTVKKSAMRASPKSAPGAAVDFQFVDNGDSTCTVLGADAAGNTSDISAVAKLDPPPTSSDPAKVKVDAPAGMTFAMHAVGPLTTPGAPVNIEVTATWLDGSKGPFKFTLPVDVVSGGPTGIQVIPGPVTVHP